MRSYSVRGCWIVCCRGKLGRFGFESPKLFRADKAHAADSGHVIVDRRIQAISSISRLLANRLSS